MQNLRNPSPFTAAEGWKESERERPATSQLDRDLVPETNLLNRRRSLSRQKGFENLHIADRTPQKAPIEPLFETPNNMYEDQNLRTPTKETPAVAETEYADAPEELLDDDDDNEPSVEEQIYLNEALEESLREGDVLGDSIPDVDEPEPERHEDRPDAFDYEHFILHSALGSYSRDAHDSERDSATSFGSVETTRRYRSPTPGAEPDGEETGDDTIIADQSDQNTPSSETRPALRGHQRNNSVDSVSTVATFATATEGNGADQEEEISQDILGWTGHQFHPHPIHPSNNHNTRTGALPTPPILSPRERVNDHKSDSLDQVLDSLMSFSNAPHQFKDLNSILNKLHKADKTLLERLLHSLGIFSSDMSLKVSNGHLTSYDRKIWRRRMDAARMILSGEVDIDPL